MTLFHILTPRFFLLTHFDANLQFLQVPIFRRALPVRGESAGGLTPAFFPQTNKGHGFSRFQRQAECRLRCLPSQKGRLFVTAATFSLPTVFVRYPPTRSTLRDNRVQRRRWGNYTISLLRTANSGLSARVSDNHSLHGYCHS